MTLTEAPAGTVKATSAATIERIFAEHFVGVESVLDATYGLGRFWKWDWRAMGFTLSGNDLYAPEPTGPNAPDAFTRMDFTDWPDVAEWHHVDVVVFDPPFTAQGPDSTGHSHNDGYGSTRTLTGAPQNIHDVERLLVEGIKQCAAIARVGLIVKTQPVVESGTLHSSDTLAANTIVKAGFNIVEWIPFSPPRRAQPKGRRVTGLGGRPSMFLVAVNGAVDRRGGNEVG